MLELHQLLHDSYGICLWTLLTFAVMAVIAALAVVIAVRQRKTDREIMGRSEIKKNNRGR